MNAMVPAQMSQAMKSICSLTDPFCVASVGSKWPDYSAAPTLPIRVDMVYTISTNASGTASSTVIPTFPYGILPATVAGTTATTAASFNDFDAGLTTYFATNVSNYRVVSFGVEVIPIVATMTNQGYFIVAETPAMRYTGTTYTSPSLTYPNVYAGNLVGEKVAFISRPQGPDANTMISANSAAGSTSCGWSGVTISVSGAQASSAVLMVRVRANLEYESVNNNVFGMSGTPSKSNTALLDLSSRVRERMTPIIKGGAEVVEKKVMGWAADALTRAVGTGIGWLLGGPAGGQAGGAIAGAATHMIMDVD